MYYYICLINSAMLYFIGCTCTNVPANKEVNKLQLQTNISPLSKTGIKTKWILLYRQIQWSIYIITTHYNIIQILKIIDIFQHEEKLQGFYINIVESLLLLHKHQIFYKYRNIIIFPVVTRHLKITKHIRVSCTE